MPRELVHRGRKINVFIDTTTSPDGVTIQRDLILHPGAVVIVPMIDDDHVCLLQNYRFILEQTLWELPAGTLEPNETPESAAARELLEESGYRAVRWRKLTEGYASPGCMNELMHLFVAQDLSAGIAKTELDELLTAHVIPWRRALDWVHDGTIRDIKTVAGLLLWDRLKDR